MMGKATRGLLVSHVCDGAAIAATGKDDIHKGIFQHIDLFRMAFFMSNGWRLTGARVTDKHAAPPNRQSVCV